MSSSLTSKLSFLSILFFCFFGAEMFCLTEERNLFASEILHQQKSEHDGMQLETPAPAGTAVDSSIIVKRNLFGSPPGEGPRDIEVVDSLAGLKATTLDLVLIGIVYGRHQDRRAIILNKREKKQQMYQTGEMVAGALIKNISRGVVVLRVNGRDEILDTSEAGNFRSKEPADPVSVAAHPSTQVDKIDTGNESEENSDWQLPERTRIVMPVGGVVETRNGNK